MVSVWWSFYHPCDHFIYFDGSCIIFDLSWWRRLEWTCLAAPFSLCVTTEIALDFSLHILWSSQSKMGITLIYYSFSILIHTQIVCQQELFSTGILWGFTDCCCYCCLLLHIQTNQQCSLLLDATQPCLHYLCDVP